MNNLRAWLHGIGAAIIGGASSALLAAFAAPQAFNFSHDGLVALLKVAIGGAAIPALAYLKQSPLPAETSTVTATVTKTVSTTPDK